MLNTSLEAVKIIDEFDSFIWTDRYSAYGDFELYLAPTEGNLTYVDHNSNEIKSIEECYLISNESEHVMIIEDIQIDSDVENGSQLYISGRSLESILNRRIIWKQTVISGNLQNAIKKLLNENIINPSDSKRKVNNLIFEESTDTAITSLKISGKAQFTGDNLYDVITSLCDIFGIGFKITLSEANQFVFKLYSGVDRSYNQSENPYVAFSPSFDNLRNSSYLKSKKNLKTITLVAGEGEGAERKTVSVDVSNGSATGLDRRELYTDARDISSNVTDENGNSTTLSPEDYNAQLTERGNEKLSEYVSIQAFEGEAEPNMTYKFETDYFIGDIVQIMNEYGIESRSRITEVMRSESSSGIEIYPTFTQIT